MIFPTFPHDLRMNLGMREVRFFLVPGGAENQAGQTGKKAEKVRAQPALVEDSFHPENHQKRGVRGYLNQRFSWDLRI